MEPDALTRQIVRDESAPQTVLTASAEASVPVIVARRPKASIAVLPFELPGQNADNLHFADGLAEDLKGQALALVKQARRLNRELRETVTQARLISHSLAPVPREGDGLMRGLMELAASTNRIPGVACRFTCDPPVCIQDVTTATHLYRIAQEAVNNALKHGPAKKIDITLTERADGLELGVENNGRAIPPANRGNSGMGLNVMRYRAEMIGATLSIESGKRKGVRVTCTLGRKI